MKYRRTYAIIALLFAVPWAAAGQLPTTEQYANSIGMRFVRIEPGSFRMGQLGSIPSELLPVFRGRGKFDLLTGGDFDEKPVHRVKVTSPFYMGVFQVTNLQYELFDPDHRQLRGKQGLSKEDNEAVVNVNWYDATAFCRWLSDTEGLPQSDGIWESGFQHL